MRTPRARLEAFEAKHGDYYELLDRYCTISSEIDRLPLTTYGQHSAVVCEEKHRALDKARSLLRKHQELISACIGYDQGYRDGLRDGAAILPVFHAPDPEPMGPIRPRGDG